jgi:Ca-activated chloride channel family protein
MRAAPLRVGLVVLGALAAREALAQDPRRAAPPVFGSTLEAVNLTVTVRGPDGELVSDLTRDDFVVREEGRAQDTRLFARAFDPQADDTMALDLGLLFDTSESMKQQIRLSQEAAIRFLDTVPRARELFVVFFDQEIRLSRYDSEGQQGLFERILETEGGGNTALYDAINVYLQRVQGGTGRKVLVLFTDGEDSISRTPLSAVLDMLKESGVVAYAISFAENLPSSRRTVAKTLLTQLVEPTGGQVFRPRGSRDLGQIYQKILDELAAQYVLGFFPEPGRADGKFRRLKVEVRRPGLKVRHRQGYFAPSGP